MTCYGCCDADLVPWSKGRAKEPRAALRCGHPGEHNGFVTQIFDAGHQNQIKSAEAPAWCPRKEK